MLVQHLLTQIFSICTLHYYDDRFVIESSETIQAAADCMNDLFGMMGILVERSKMYGPGHQPTILGVLSDLQQFVVQITEQRRSDLLE